MRGAGLSSKSSAVNPLVGVQVVYSFEVGGSEMLALRLATALDSPAGRWGLVAARSAEGPVSEQAQRAGLDARWLDIERVSRLDRLRRLWRLGQWLRQRKVQVAHVHHLVSLRDTYWALRLGGVRRIVLTEHTAEPFLEARHLPTIWRIYDRLVDTVTVVSEGIAEDVQRRVVGARTPIVIPNGVDTEYFIPRPAAGANAETRWTIGWLGRLHPHKDVCTGIRAFAAFCGKSVGPRSLRMIIGGTGPDEAKSRAVARELDMTSRIEFRGAINDARSFLHECNVLLISSVTEGLPLVLLEAMSCGVPVVATDVGGIREAMGGAGRVCPAGDVKEMAHQLGDVLGSQLISLQVGHRGRQRAIEQYSMTEMVARYREVLLGEALPQVSALSTDKGGDA